MKRWSQDSWILPLISGAIVAVSYFTFGLPATNFVAFVPLLVWIDARREAGWSTWRSGGAVFGLTVNLAILHWMYSMLWVSWLAVPCYLGLAGLFAAETTVCVMLLAWARRWTGWSFAVLLPAFWLPVEWLQAQGDLRMTAQHLAHTLAGAPFLVQFADLTGPYGVGAFLLVVNALVYETCRASGGARMRRGAVLGSVVLVVLVYDAYAWTKPIPAGRTVRAAFIQPNIPLLEKMDASTAGLQWAALSRLTLEAAREHPDLIVWPETAKPDALYHDPARPSTFAMPDVAELARESGATILTGAEYVVYRDATRYDLYNAVLAIRPDGTLDPEWTAKAYLVPFVEGIPFEPLLGPILSPLGGSLRWLSGGFAPGPHGKPLPAAGVAVGVSVCFEELYFDLQRALRNAGAQIQVVVTNHAWFRRSLFQTYAANAVRLRAIENRTAFVRAANTGISGFVDPRGRYHEATALFTEDIRVADLPVVSGRTVYDRIGDVPAWAAWIALISAIVVGIRRRRDAGGAPEGPPVGEPNEDPKESGPGEREEPPCESTSTS